MSEIVKSNKFQIVKFNGTDLVCPIIKGQPFVVMKCIFDDLNMNTKKATGTLKNHPRFGSRVAEWQPAVNVNGLSNKHSYLCLPFQKIAGWLYSVSINRVGEEVKPILIFYQEKCDDVLFDFFYGGSKNIVSYTEKALPISSEIKQKEKEIEDAKKIHEATNEYLTLVKLKDDLAKLKAKKRNLERSFLEPTLF